MSRAVGLLFQRWTFTIMALVPTRYLGVLKTSICGGRPSGRRGLPPVDGIANFGKVDARLWRSGQPDPAALAILARRGVKTLVNLRMPGDLKPAEAAFAQRHGIIYHQIPLSGVRAPTKAQIARLFKLVDGSAPPVLMHCEHGSDRTGTFVACYRILRQGWSAEQALVEADRYGMSTLMVGMKNFIRRFQVELSTWMQALASGPGPFRLD